MKSDYQQVVEYLRDLRQSPLQTVTDEIAQAASEYAALCVEANERLRKCSTFLQQGLRSEAIHLADESPNLLDLVAALDLPDTPTWNEFCQNNGLAAAPPLQIDRATQLNDAYALDQPLEHLLTKHRLLALSRGPVRERLELLRQIAQIDTGSGAWEKDIRVFEKARLRELPTSFYNAVKNRDDQGIAGLMREITQTPWFEQMPADLSTAVSDAFNRMQRANCEAELGKLIEPLRDAFAARSLQECQALVRRWKKVMTAAGVTRLSAALEDEIKPVVAFVNEQEKREELLKRFRDSCKAFGKMLDSDLPDAQLEAGYAKLGEFKEPIPEELTARYAERRQSRQKQTERGHRVRLMTIGASAAGVVVVALCVGFYFMRGVTAANWAATIRTDNEKHSRQGLEAAEKAVADVRKNHPAFLNDPQVAAAMHDTEELKASWDRDSAALADQLKRIEEARQGAIGADKATSSTDELLAAASDAQAAAEQAPKDGRLNWVDEKTELSNAVLALMREATNLRAAASAGVHKELEAAQAKVDALNAAPGTASQAFDQLAQIDNRLSTLKTAVGLDEETQAAIGRLAGAVDKLRQTLTSQNDVAGALDQIRQRATSADDLKKALADFDQRFPNDPRRADFEQAIARLPLARAMEAWRPVAAAWGGKFAPGLADIQKRIDTINGFLTAYPESPNTQALTTYIGYLKQSSDALADNGTWQAAFTDLIANPLLSELSYVEDSKHNKYYVTNNMKRKESTLNGEVSVSFEAIDPTDVQKRKFVVVRAPDTVSDKPLRAPQDDLVKGIGDEVKGIDETNWDTWGIDFIDRIKKREDIDLVVRVILIHQALKTENTVAGWALGAVYAKPLAQLAREKPEELPFIDPAAVSPVTRKALEAILGEIPAAAEMKAKLAAAKKGLFQWVGFDVAAGGGIGVALKDDAGKWTISAKGGMLDGNVAWTVAPGTGAAGAPAAADAGGAGGPGGTGANPGSFLRIGTVAGGKFVPDETNLSTVPQGSIVYLMRP